ncbi:uncharacterized protein STEHIDRAFT_69453 [Stereum hirsutum FP-91666 SS1]|uniref:T6SS Phospholipase effector Tle1-like catalytic domain-containing protein n=1 Tax=Stereum hirsutum (strain FP-91666) TaxID=721885 RepID=R7RXB5_STEHR|nr:uncharacterized protein STEHIDRAFT_69453 [Stereum hirsutum FP-91666 SS1]EIM79463.1 hypothetical protein STEHIDRAFT_69453 [Stereum hirsutum FP-91666 SS1]
MKRIIIAYDGTGQSASHGDWSIYTNVNRLCHALLNSPDLPVQQLVFYVSGVGTQDLGLGGFGTVIQGALGEGVEENMADGYAFIVNNYLPGDELFVFGFSRGAFTARVLANIVARLGVFSKPYSWEFKDALSEYKKGKEAFEAFLGVLGKREKGVYIPRLYEVKVKVVGCWDTVASLGIPWRPTSNAGGVSGDYEHFDGGLFLFHHFIGIENAFHALALDECRGPFTPTMWYLPTDKDAANCINLKQTWFPGVHSNVGGGYPDQALADLSLSWMIDLCRPFLSFDLANINLEIDLSLNPWKIRSKKRMAHKDGPPDVEWKGWACGKWYDSYKNGKTWSWKYRTPGMYENERELEKGDTNETMHASVKARWDMLRPSWRPKALEGFRPEVIEGGGIEWVKRDSKGKELLMIKEEPFLKREPAKPDFSAEWMLRYTPITPKPSEQTST